MRRIWVWARRYPGFATTIVAVGFAALLGIGKLWVQERRAVSADAVRTMLEARLAREGGMHALGLARAERALAVDPGLHAAELLRAQALIDLGRGDEVVREATIRLEKGRREWLAHLILAYAATNDRDPQNGIDAPAHLLAAERLAPESSEAYYLRARIAAAPPEKLALLERALELDPNDVAALVERIDLFLEESKDFHAALLDAKRMRESHPRYPQGHLMRARAYGGLRDYERAFHAIRWAVARTNDEERPVEAAWNRWVRGEINAARGGYPSAIFHYGEALEVIADFPVALRSRAACFVRVGRFDKAVADARRAVRLDPDDWRSYAVLLDAHARSGATQQLRSVVEELRERAGQRGSPHTRARMHAVLSDGYRSLGNVEQALLHAERQIELDPRGPGGYVRRIRLRGSVGDDRGIAADCDRLAALEIADLDEGLSRARELAETCDRPEQALESYTRVIEAAPYWADPYYEKGRVHLARAESMKALDAFNHAIERARTWAEPFRERSLVHGRAGRWGRALADIDWAIELNPGSAEARHARALLLMDLERFDDALDEFDRISELRPGASRGSWERARALLRLGREEEALAVADEAVEDGPDSDLALRRRALLLAFLGRTEEALTTAERAVEHSPQDVWNYLCRARMILYAGGGCRRLLADLETALRLAPDDAAVAAEIAWQQAAMIHGRCPGGYDDRLAADRAQVAVEGRAEGAFPSLAQGMVLYRQGRFQEAREALLRSVALRPRPEPQELFALAMIEWKLGDRVRPRRYYDSGVARSERTYPRFPEYLLLRDEAASLLGATGSGS